MESRLTTSSIITRPSTPQYPVIFRDPTFKQIRSNFGFGDFAFSLGVPTLLTSGYYYTTRLHKASTIVWATFLYPTVYILGCERVSQRLQGTSNNEKDCSKHGIPFTRNTTPYNL